MLNQRLSTITEESGSPILAGQASWDEGFGIVDEFSVATQIDPSRWTEAVNVMEQELRRACQFGFSEQEFTAISARVMPYFKSAAEQAESRENSSLADAVVSNLGRNQVVTHPEFDCRFLEELLRTLSVDSLYLRSARPM